MVKERRWCVLCEGGLGTLNYWVEERRGIEDRRITLEEIVETKRR